MRNLSCSSFLEDNIGNRQESTPTGHHKKILRHLTINSEDIFVDMGAGVGVLC
jgi:hypothetical protein